MAKVNIPRLVSRVILLLLPIIMLILFFTKIVGTTYTPTKSMEPTIMTGDRVLYNRLAYVNRNVARGDVVIAKKDNVQLLKRVIAIAGDTVEVKENTLYVNNREVAKAATSNKKFTVPQGKVFLVGDNWENSNDSLVWNDPYVPVSNILGKVYFSFGTNGGFHVGLQ